MRCLDYSFDSWEEVEQFLEEAEGNGYNWVEVPEDFKGVDYLRDVGFKVESGSLNLWYDGAITFDREEQGNTRKYVKGTLPVRNKPVLIDDVPYTYEEAIKEIERIRDEALKQ